MCSNCEGSALKLKLLWTRLLHHVSNDHDYCNHPALDQLWSTDTAETDTGREYLSSHGGTMKKLREIILDPKWLKSLDRYTRNRHTGMLEVCASFKENKKVILYKSFKSIYLL